MTSTARPTRFPAEGWSGDARESFHTRAMAALLPEGAHGHLVTSDAVDAAGGLTLTFEEGLCLEVLPTAAGDDAEQWRLLRPRTGTMHLIVFGDRVGYGARRWSRTPGLTVHGAERGP